MGGQVGEYLLLGQVAERFGCQLWQIQRLFDRGLLPPPDRLGRYRVVRAADLPAVGQALREAGFLKGPAPDAGPAR